MSAKLYNNGLFIFLSLGCLSLQTASKLLDPSMLGKMKLFKGGLQAVLRNQHQTFMGKFTRLLWFLQSSP